MKGAILALTVAATAAGTAHKPGPPWFDGTVEQAFSAAKTQQRPLLLYWGAVWCPPCNELKSQVFSQPRFAELVSPLIPVYLDGDDESAQAWGETLKVSGYPTVLLLDPSGRELMRLGTSVDLGEFEAALAAGLAAPGGFDAAFGQALAGRASDAQWRLLAYFGWDAMLDGGSHPQRGEAQLLTDQAKLALAAPARLRAERAVLAGRALEAAAAAESPAGVAAAAQLRPNAPALLDLLLADAASARAGRSTVANAAADVLGWAYPAPSPEQEQADQRWLQAADRLAADPTVSVNTRLDARATRLALFRLRHKDAPVPPELRREVQAAAHAADQGAKTAFERHATISDAAGLLAQVGDRDGARQLLDRELATTDTPWYYQSAYARLETEAGNQAAALAWAAKARASVKGRASRLQWIVADLTLTANTGDAAQEARLLGLVKEYYETALALPDGFQGRNATRARQVAKALRPWLPKPGVRQLVATYAGKCARDACKGHFKEMSL